MGNKVPFKIFEDIYTKKSIDKSSDDRNNEIIDNCTRESLPLNIRNMEYNNIEQKEHMNNEKNTQEYTEDNENSEMEKIKKQNFYLLDESLNSNNIKHPCHAQWFLFWVFASYLNDKFSESEKEYVHSFYSYFPDQCIEGKGKNCFTEFLKIYPIRAETREELMTWLQMCENYCRKKADLPLKFFNYNKLLKRWRFDDEYV
ncbi:conserved Plasmodium protein, unknown function [Plasmodium gallinaceum]|uniref:Sulfhydryl oxidase n=1 Tax=Plasmodium gallinaceum TaxID=5849 RepID=A0A1J1GSQ7_PLAGA|nr:conserved Plasmodium protein, unknown function [Plasmodium gallinaceum]CRG94083.1 conserved Plasmodium protein, unknown function [Plasmodium gallinaceum]